MDQTQRLDWEDEEEETSAEKNRPAGNLHMFAGIHGPAQDFPIYPGLNVIGRHSSCDITLPAQSVSKKHAILNVTGDCHTICDNGSLNKTRRSKVALEPDVRYALSDGDFLLFADVACRYSIVKKIEVETVTGEESEDDSILVPGTQAALAIKETPAAAIRRIGRRAVLARDSGDEDEEVQRGWNEGGEGGSRDARGTSRPKDAVFSSPAGDTVVPESDEENDTSNSETHFPTFHLRCENNVDNQEAPTKESPLIPSALNTFTTTVENEPTKEESNRLLQINKEDKPVREETDDQENKTHPVGSDAASNIGLLEELKERRDEETDDRLPCGAEKIVQSETLNTGVRDTETNVTNGGSHENVNNLNNDAANIETTEVSSTSSHCSKDNENETSKMNIAATIVPESNPNNHTQAEENNLKPTEKDLKVEAGFCLDSDTDVDEEVPTTSRTDVIKNDDLETKSDKEPKQSNVEALEPSESDVHMDRDVNVDEEKTSFVQHDQVSKISTDHDTDAEDDTEVSKARNAETRTGNEKSIEVPKVHAVSGINVSADLDINSDTDVEDEDLTTSHEKMIDQESTKFLEEKKEPFHMDSDTDVEDDGEVSSTKLKQGDFDSMSAFVPLPDPKDEIHLDSDTDVEEDLNVSSTDVTKGKQSLNMDIQEGLHMDSDTDVEDVDISSTVVTKKKQNSVQDEKSLPLDSDTDVDDEDQRPGSSSAAVQSRVVTESRVNDQQVGTNKKDAAGVINKEAAQLHFDSDTDVDENTSTGSEPKKVEGPVNTTAEKNEAEAVNEEAVIHTDSGTDVDDTSVGPDESQPSEGELGSDRVSERNVGNLEKVSRSSVGEPGGASEVHGADSSIVTVESSEDETQKTDLQDEEEATQAYILSSTWAEPDPFKRPSDPVGVLQVSALTLDNSEEDLDESALAETQLFCLEADTSPSHQAVKDTLQPEEEFVDKRQETQPSTVEGSGKEVQEPLQGVIALEDTEPVSPSLSTKPPVEAGTWLHLKRDVPTSVWMKSLQQDKETSDVKSQPTQEDSTQDEMDLQPLELEATQSYILEAPNVQQHFKQDHSPSLLTLQEDHTTLDKSALPASEDTSRDLVNLDPGVLAVPSTESSSTVPSIPKTDISEVQVSESTPTRLSMPETGVSAVLANESTPTASSTSDTDVLTVPLSEDPPAEPSNFELGVSAVPGTESLPKEMSTMETQVIEDDATQVFSLDLPVSDVNVPPSKLEISSTEDATQSCISNEGDTAAKEPLSSGVTKLVMMEEETKLTKTEKEQPSSKRGVRSRKKEQPEKDSEISNEKGAVEAPSTPEETSELGAGESRDSGPRIMVSETREEKEPEKGGRRRGGCRKATEEPKSKLKTKDELVMPNTSHEIENKMASESEPSTSGINEERKKQPRRKSVVKMKGKQDEVKEDSTYEKSKNSNVSKTLTENNAEKIESLRSKDDVIVPASVEVSVGPIESDGERDVTGTSLDPDGSGDKNVSTSSKSPKGEESRILDVPEQSETLSAPQSKKPLRGKRQAATKSKPENIQETKSNSEQNTEPVTSATHLEKQENFQRQTSKISDSQDGGQEGPRGRRTRRSHNSPTKLLEKQEVADTKAKLIEDVQNSENVRSIRQRRNVKETGRLTSKRVASLRGNQKKEINSQQTLENNPDSSSLPKRARRYSRGEMPKPEQDVTQVGKTDEESLVKLPRRTRKSNKEEPKPEDNEGSPESSITSEAQTRKTRSARQQDIVNKEETVKETVTRKRRVSNAEDTQLGEDLGKQFVRTRRVSKEDLVPETAVQTKKEDATEQNTSGRKRRSVKADDKTESLHTVDIKADSKPSRPDRLSSRTRKATTEDGEKLLEGTEAKGESTKKREVEPSAQAPRRGRPRKTSVKEEPSQVSPPVVSRKGRQAANANIELKRKKSNETEEAEKKIKGGRRGRTRKLSKTDDSQTSAGGRETDTPELSPSPSPSCSSRRRQTPPVAEVRTLRGRSTAVAASRLRPKVLFTCVVDTSGEEIVRSLGGCIATSVFECTHLITNCVRRTVKFVCAVARGVPIVTLDWLDKCKKNGCFLSHTQFLVKDEEQEKNYNFVLSKSLLKAKKKPLFQGYEIHVTSRVKPEPEVMKDIICCSGATFLPALPRTYKEKCVVVSCAEDAAGVKSVPSGIPVTTVEFILTGILRQEINPDAYLLSNEAENSAPVPAKRRR